MLEDRDVMDVDCIVIDAIDGGMIEISEMQYEKIQNWQLSQLQGKPIQFSKDQGGNNAHIKFHLSLQAFSEEFFEYALKYGQIVPFLDMRDGKGFLPIKPLRSSHWRFLANGTASMHIRLTTLTKKSACLIKFELINKHTSEPIPCGPSESIPIEVVSKFKETYQLKKEKESKKHACQSDDDDTDAESMDGDSFPPSPKRVRRNRKQLVSSAIVQEDANTKEYDCVDESILVSDWEQATRNDPKLMCADFSVDFPLSASDNEQRDLSTGDSFFFSPKRVWRNSKHFASSAIVQEDVNTTEYDCADISRLVNDWEQATRNDPKLMCADFSVDLPLSASDNEQRDLNTSSALLNYDSDEFIPLFGLDDELDHPLW